jgi:hypothetical protein
LAEEANIKGLTGQIEFLANVCKYSYSDIESFIDDAFEAENEVAAESAAQED